MNILPTLASRWQLVNCTYSALSFTFTGAGSARVTLLESDIKSLAPGTLSAVVLPGDLTLPTDIRCNIFVRTSNAYNHHSCFLLSNTGDFYSALLDLTTGAYVEAYVELTTTGACTVQQLSLDIVTQSYDEIIEELRGELPKLLADYNTYDMTLTTEEVTVGLITANLLENTDLQGHFTLSFLASNKAEIVLRIYDDLRKCLYSPSIISVNAGKHTIGFPHSYLKSHIGYHNFYVTLQATEGNVKIPTRAMLYTIDGAHMAERLLDSFYMINDITAKTEITSVEPTMLYTVGVVDNIATIRHIAPNEIGLSNWTVDFVLPNVKEAAIEFDGIFEVVGETLRLLTDEYPSIFWTDLNNNLWYQYWSDESTKQQLATNVLNISVCRGWNSKLFPEQDMGLVVAYVTLSGTVAYRARVGKAAGTPVWESEEQLEEAGDGNTKVHVHRLNDYRLGFSVTGCNKHFITERTTIGFGAAPQSVVLRYFGKPLWTLWYDNVDSGTQALSVDADNSERQSVTTTIIKFNYPIYLLDESITTGISAEKQNGQPLNIVSLIWLDNRTIRLETEPYSLYADLVIKFAPTSAYIYSVQNEFSSSTAFVPTTPFVIPGEEVPMQFAGEAKVRASFVELSIVYDGLEFITQEQPEDVNVATSLADFEIVYDALNFVAYEDINHGEALIVATFTSLDINHEYVGSEPL